MLSGFECDQDQTGWLAGLAVWTTGAAAGCLLAMATVEPALLHGQVLVLAVAVTLVSLGLRLPVMLTHDSNCIWLVHAVWMLAIFAQLNWAGFLAARSADGTIAAEALFICLGPEIWLSIMFVAKGKLPWLQQLFQGSSMERMAVVEVSKAVHEDLLPSELTMQLGDQNIRRELVDGIAENGQRYMSGSVRLHFAALQRSEGFVLSFCPAFDGLVSVELECDAEDVTAKVEHATEIGARITVRRATIGEATPVTVDWYATAAAQEQHAINLP